MPETTKHPVLIQLDKLIAEIERYDGRDSVTYYLATELVAPIEALVDSRVAVLTSTVADFGSRPLPPINEGALDIQLRESKAEIAPSVN